MFMGFAADARALVLQKIVNSLSKETVLWKLEMLNSSAKYANSRLQDVKADVLVLARFVAFCVDTF